MSGKPLLSVENLTVEFDVMRQARRVVDDISFQLAEGETLVLVGESGSGKSMSASAILSIIDSPPGRIASGTIRFAGTDLVPLSRGARRQINGREIGIVFQDPLAHLNPVYTIGRQMAEIFLAHGVTDRREIRAETIRLLERVGLPDPQRRIGQYPHQFSGGQRQRIMIAMAIALKPRLLIADEPTTALDVTIQKQVLDLLKRLQHEEGMALLLITHDLGVAGYMGDRVAVMHQGRIVETGSVADVFSRASDPYTQRLVAAARQRSTATGWLTPGADEPPVLEVSNLVTEYRQPGMLRRTLRAVDDVSFTLRRGETLAVIGESGSGKSTLARTLVRMEKATSGTMLYAGQNIAEARGADLFSLRRKIQMIFQDPYSSLNPNMTIGTIISEPLKVQHILPPEQWEARVLELLEMVGLKPEHAGRFPHQFSGGQRQRIAIARALACEPDLLICDEAVSALDVSIQMQIIALLDALRRRLGVAIIFITHDLEIAASFAENILVMRSGKLVDSGRARDLLQHPTHEYTSALTQAVLPIEKFFGSAEENA